MSCSLNIKWWYHCLDFTTTTVHSSHYVSGTWNTVCALKNRSCSNHLQTMNETFQFVSGMQWSIKPGSWERVSHSWLYEVLYEMIQFPEGHCPKQLSDWSAVIHGAWLPSVDKKKKKYWQTVHHSCWINHLSTSQKWLECSFILHVYLLIKISGET